MTSIRAHLEQNHPDRVEKFVANSPAAVKMIVSDIDNFQVALRSRNHTPIL